MILNAINASVAKANGSLSIFLGVHKSWVYSFSKSEIETWKQIGMAPGWQIDWIANQPWFSGEISCLVAEETAQQMWGFNRTIRKPLNRDINIYFFMINCTMTVIPLVLVSYIVWYWFTKMFTLSSLVNAGKQFALAPCKNRVWSWLWEKDSTECESEAYICFWQKLDTSLPMYSETNSCRIPISCWSSKMGNQWTYLDDQGFHHILHVIFPSLKLHSDCTVWRRL